MEKTKTSKQNKNKEKSLLNEGDEVWHVDGYKDKSGKLKWYPKKGKVEAVKKNGDYIVRYYFGLSILPKDEDFKSKEECNHYIALYKENEYYED